MRTCEDLGREPRGYNHPYHRSSRTTRTSSDPPPSQRPLRRRSREYRTISATETYLRDLRTVYSTGQAVAETSYYGPLAALLNTVGRTLRPRVHAVVNLQNRGAGIPDGGLFSHEQLRDSSLQDDDAASLRGGQLPSRGVLEVKGASADVTQVANSEQVRRYLRRYGSVLVTNYRDFLPVTRGPDGEAVAGEPYRLADTEAAFWRTPVPTLLAEHAGRFEDYLRRVMLQGAPLADPKDVAWFLASYAREAKARLGRSDLPTLAGVRTSLEEALGIHFQAAQGEAFFRSTLIQTLFYGIFSAWVLWHKTAREGERFDWRVAAYTLKVPVIRALFYRVADPERLETLGLVEVLGWTGDTLNRVDRALFFRRFNEGAAVQYFYEPFLEAFDPDLRRQLGVWYTPPEIVRYMVERVDRTLRDELGVEGGLADENVYVLDPCCGTGAYLVEVLARIETTLRERGDDALLGSDLKRAATTRVFGFELLPAPFVVAHLQMGLLLQNLGTPLAGRERAAVYLTNALTGWREGEQPRLEFPELAEERDTARALKRQNKILVVLGNPPYNGFAGMAIDEERELSDAYRTTRRAPKPRGQGLNDLYIRFFRMAERQIVEGTGRGVVCFISNYSWLDGLSFTGMRERYLELFSSVQIDSLNGDRYRTGKLTPEGLPDPSVFSTPMNREGIQVGTAIATLTRTGPVTGSARVQFRNLWGRDKLQQLATAEHDAITEQYEEVEPVLEMGLPFTPSQNETGYFEWPSLTDLFPTFFPGVQTKRDELVVDISLNSLTERMGLYFNPAVSNAEMAEICPKAMSDTASFAAAKTRNYLISRGFKPEFITRYCHRPFDMRWIYWEPETSLLGRKVPQFFSQLFEGNKFLVTTVRTRKNVIEPALASKSLTDLNCMDSGASAFPLHLISNEGTVFQEIKPNLSSFAKNYLATLACTEDDLFHHYIALQHSQAYRSENKDAIRFDWPRVVLPSSAEALSASAELGRAVAALLDTETGVSEVVSGSVRPPLRGVGVVSALGGGRLDPDAGDLALAVNWGYRNPRGAIMPGSGRAVQRAYSEAELQSMGAAGLELEGTLALLGETTFDVFLNGRAYWRNVPERVWTYTLGGYQVVKKWLSYREEGVLGRALTADEAREVTNMTRRIAALLLLEPALDANYALVKGAAFVQTGQTQSDAEPKR